MLNMLVILLRYGNLGPFKKVLNYLSIVSAFIAGYVQIRPQFITFEKSS